MATLVWLTAHPPALTCGHVASPQNGRPGPYPREWYCDLCDLGTVAQLDQELAAVAEWARPRQEPA